jgi:DNA polymerase-1
MPRDNVLFIDGSALMYRAAYRAVHRIRGAREDALRSFYRNIIELDDLFRPTYLAFVLDCPRDKSKRRQLFPAYKAQRKPRDPAIGEHVDDLKQLAREIGLPIVELPEHEADDVIASLAAQFAGPEVRIRVVSRDKDFHQIIRRGVSMWDPFDNQRIGPRQVRERWGVKPAQVLEVQCLAGDTADNIPGAPGIGPVRATKLVQEHGTARRVWKRRRSLSPGLASSLEEFDIETGYALVRLRTDLPLPVTSSDLEWNGIPSKTQRMFHTCLAR